MIALISRMKTSLTGFNAIPAAGKSHPISRPTSIAQKMSAVGEASRSPAVPPAGPAEPWLSTSAGINARARGRPCPADGVGIGQAYAPAFTLVALVGTSFLVG